MAATILTTTYDSTTDTNAITITLASLAHSATWTGGQESTVVTNASNMFIDYLVYGRIKLGASAVTAGEFRIYVHAPQKIASSTATYTLATTTALTGGDAVVTAFTASQLANLRLAAAITCPATNAAILDIPPFSIASCFGGVVPIKWGLYVAHNTTTILDATAGSHWLHWTAVKYTST